MNSFITSGLGLFGKFYDQLFELQFCCILLRDTGLVCLFKIVLNCFVIFCPIPSYLLIRPIHGRISIVQ